MYHEVNSLLSFCASQLPFPTIGSLNGVHIFTENQEAELLSNITGDRKVIWRCFHDRSVVIDELVVIT